MDLAMEIRRTLSDYQEALIRQSTLASLPHPSRQTMTALSNYFHTRTTVAHRAAAAASQQQTTTMTYPLLTGASSKLYTPGMTEAQIRLSITRAGIQGLEDDFNLTIIFKVLTRSLRSTQYRLT